MLHQGKSISERHSEPPYPYHQDHQHYCRDYNYQPKRGFHHNSSSRYFGNRRNFDNRRRDQHRDNTWHHHHMEPQGNPSQGYTPPGRDDQLQNPTPSPFEHCDPSTSALVTCFNCNQPVHSANQCSNDTRGKAPAINMITMDVQQVTTRSKTTQSSQWDTQDSICRQATEWVEAANNRNIDHMKTDTATFPQNQSEPPQLVSANSPNTTNPTEPNEEWQALANSQISMPLHKLLHLFPRFKENIHSLTARKMAQPMVHLMAPVPGPRLMDSENPAVQIFICRHQVAGCIIDGGSGINVISEATCSKLGITE